MDTIYAVLIGALLYIILCFIIAFVRMVFSKPQKRKQSLKETFWTFFLEILNPFNWMS